MFHGHHRLAPLLLIAGAIGTPALGGPTFKSASGGSVTFSGSFNPGYFRFDDGVGSYTELADNATNDSFVNMQVTQPLGAGLTFGFDFQTYFGFRSSSDIGQGDVPEPLDWDRTDIQILAFSLSGAFGTLSAGQGKLAGYGASGTDFGQTVNVTELSFDSNFGGYAFRTGAGALSEVTVNDAFPTFDWIAAGRVRYDTPTTRGVQFSVSWGQDILDPDDDTTYLSAAATYQAKLAGGQIGAALATYRAEDTGNGDFTATYGSASYLSAGNVVFTLGAGTQSGSGSFSYAKLGYNADWLHAGTTALAVDYYRGNDFVTDGSESSSWGVGVSQWVADGNMQIYAGYRQFAYDQPGASFLDATGVVLGFAYNW
ncbi:porin [Chachezhania sediminis]|uniref:porin n=1 Tax=Chachezhania sediminis TaxID=2599291 RepID=UPI00131D2757|nr:porin [Chachezhania sediminis]